MAISVFLISITQPCNVCWFCFPFIPKQTPENPVRLMSLPRPYISLHAPAAEACAAAQRMHSCSFWPHRQHGALNVTALQLQAQIDPVNKRVHLICWTRSCFGSEVQCVLMSWSDVSRQTPDMLVLLSQQLSLRSVSDWLAPDLL